MPAFIQPTLGALAMAIVLKSLLLLALVQIVAWFMRRSSAASRHFYLAAAALALLFLPLAAYVLPSWDIGNMQYPLQSRIERPLPAQARAVAEKTEALERTTGTAQETTLQKRLGQNGRTSRLYWLDWIFVIWFCGAFVLLLRLLGGKLFVHCAVRRFPLIIDPGFLKTVSDISEQLKIQRKIPVFESARSRVPFVSGFFKPKLILPSQAKRWPEERLEAILRHELAHIKRRDIPVQFLAQIACCLYWINPLAWILERRLFIERERACDDLALGKKIKASDYAGHLMEVLEELGTQRNDIWIVAAMAEGTDFKDRIISVLNPAASRHPPRLKHLSAVLVFTLTLLLPLSALNPWASDSASLQQTQNMAAQKEQQEPLSQQDSQGDSRLVLLLKQIKSPSVDLRRNAVRALGELGDPEAVEPLIGTLQDESPDVREHVCTALGKLGDKQAVQPLVKVLNTDPDPNVKSHALSALRKLGYFD